MINAGDYAELHAHSYYSLLDGSSSPQSLVRRAAEVGLAALALTDHDAVYGVIPFAEESARQGIKPILGTEITLEDDSHLTLLVADERGWQNLCWLITCARMNAPKGKAALRLNELEGRTEGLIALSGCARGGIAKSILNGEKKQAIRLAEQFKSWFAPDHFWIELQHHVLPEDNLLTRDLVSLAQHLKLGYVATNNVHYAEQSQHRLQDVLVCIDHNMSLDESHDLRRPNSEYYLKSSAQMSRLFRDYPAAISNTLIVAEQCQYKLQYGLQDLPVFPTPKGESAASYLRSLCEIALQKKGLSHSEKAWETLWHELNIIERQGLANYFLIVWDIVSFARDHEILCQGRGSAANSLIAYLLNISPINPITHELVFERFLSDERQVVPDIDIDFDAARREEVIQYVYKRYGLEHTAMSATFVTFRSKSAIRDVGKALGLPTTILTEAALAVERGDPIPSSSYSEQLRSMCEQIHGLPRHLGIHNGGMVVMGSPMARRLPTEPATMQDRYVVQWDKEMLETAGIVKIDILGLRMLSAIAETVEIIDTTTGHRPDLERLAFDDAAVYAQITDADTIGVFQVESRAQSQVLPRLKPKNFSDVIVSISLIRPGPVQGNMVHPYLNRRVGKEAVVYPHELLKPALSETLGVILFQEQILKVARDLAGFRAGQGEQLRRALGNKNAGEAIKRFHAEFIEGALQNGVGEEIAEAVFDSLRAFGGYSFPKSHAAAFAVLVYRSAWLKHYYPHAFYVALLNNQPMGFYSPAVIVNDARRRGIEILPVDINISDGKCVVEESGIRLGFNYVSGIGDAALSQITRARETGEFTTLSDFYKRTKLPRRLVENLILVGAMDQFGLARRKLLWELGKLSNDENELDIALPDDELELAPLTHVEMMAAENQLLGVSAGEHIMTLYVSWMKQHGILGSKALAACKDGDQVKVAGLIVVHQAPPTAKGFHFVTLEDEDGMINVIVKPRVYARYRRVLREAPLLVVEGNVQREGEVVNVILFKVRDLMPT